MPTEDVLKSSNDSLTNYGKKVEEAKDAIEKTVQVAPDIYQPVLKEMKEVIADLEKEQVRVEENYKTVRAVVVDQAHTIAEQERITNKPRFTLGFEMNYSPLLNFNPNVTVGVMFKHGLFYIKGGLGFNLEQTRAEIQNIGFNNMVVGVGGMYIF